VSNPEDTTSKHIDEITLLLYVERQLDRESAQEVSLHTQTCTACLTLLRALDRESRLLTRAMLEQDEPLPARIAEFRLAVKKSMQWIWGLVFGLAVLGVYALYSTYIEPWENRLGEAGFGSSSLLSLLFFQGAFWKGWQSMFTLFEFLALGATAGFGMFAFRKFVKRGSALALLFASLGLLVSLPAPVSATEFRKGDSVEVRKDETIKGDFFATANHIRIEGTVDGDAYAFGQQVDVSGHVTGDLICFCQSSRITGQIDGNIRAFANNVTISGTVDKSVTAFDEIFTLDSNGKIGRSLTDFSKSLTVDGKLGTDVLAFCAFGNVSGTIGGDLRVKGDSLTVSSGAVIGGKARFEGNKPPDVSSGAKLASPMEFVQTEHNKSRFERGGGYYFWRGIWTATYILFGLVLFGLLPIFAKDTAEMGEHYGASFGLGVLVLFAVPIAALIICCTVIGLFVGISTLLLWFVVFLAAQVVVGTIVGKWIMGRTSEFWPLVGRMAVGLIIVRIVTLIPFIGGWAKFAVILWGMGAISLALYRRLQPMIAPSVPSVPMAPVTTPLPPTTTVGGV
jgi:cytoskeletal protein CcmA (bactofilin family)